MKKSFTFSIFLTVAVFVSSCKKDDSQPAPTTNTPVVIVNQPSTTAPYLETGVSTSLTVNVGSGNSKTQDLSDDVIDPQGDTWTITHVASSNINIVGVAIKTGNNQAIEYTGVAAGDATISITVSDASGNSNVLTYTVTVTTSPVVVEVSANAGPTLNAGVNTSFNIQEGSNSSWDLSTKVTDAEGDTWTITSISSSNSSIATATIESSLKSIDYVGRGPGVATLTITLTDARNATSTVSATINVSPKPTGPKAVEVK
jgi:hypothetical protein